LFVAVFNFFYPTHSLTTYQPHRQTNKQTIMSSKLQSFIDRVSPAASPAAAAAASPAASKGGVAPPANLCTMFDDANTFSMLVYWFIQSALFQSRCGASGLLQKRPKPSVPNLQHVAAFVPMILEFADQLTDDERNSFPEWKDSFAKFLVQFMSSKGVFFALTAPAAPAADDAAADHAAAADAADADCTTKLLHVTGPKGSLVIGADDVLANARFVDVKGGDGDNSDNTYKVSSVDMIKSIAVTIVGDDEKQLELVDKHMCAASVMFQQYLQSRYEQYSKAAVERKRKRRAGGGGVDDANNNDD
jgi:hypothetical protein